MCRERERERERDAPVREEFDVSAATEDVVPPIAVNHGATGSPPVKDGHTL